MADCAYRLALCRPPSTAPEHGVRPDDQWSRSGPLRPIGQAVRGVARYDNVLRSRSRGGQRWDSPRRTLSLAVAVIALAALSGCESTAADRSQVVALVNQSRAQAGLGPVIENATLDIKADRWAQHLRDLCDLEHSDLADGAPDEWLKLGENVGYGGTISAIHDAYLESPGHRANIMDPSFTSMGAAAVYGVCSGQHRVFTVQVFMKS